MDFNVGKKWWIYLLIYLLAQAIATVFLIKASNMLHLDCLSRVWTLLSIYVIYVPYEKAKMFNKP